MNISRRWAFWRRVQYGSGFGVFWVFIGVLVYANNFYVPPNCLDGKQNGEEVGVDCGGGCQYICAYTVAEPSVQWARSFRVTESQYNAVAYVENINQFAASPEVPYTLTLYTDGEIIAERTGTTILPPDSVYPVFEARIDTQGRIPTQTFLEIGDVTKWVDATGGRDQFVVQSRTLTGADAQPRLEAQIYNNTLLEAREVEVIATIFDARGNALTSSRTFIDDFAGQTTETAIFTWPEPIAKTLRSCEVPTDVVMAIDLSGSMNNDGDTPPEPITSVLQAARSFASRLENGDQVSLVTFATQASLNSVLTGNVQDVARSISGLVIDPEEETGSTNTGEALLQAGKELASVRHNTEARKIVVLLTDGLATAPDENPEEYALSAAASLKQQGVNLFTIGLGQKVNMDFVNSLASTPQQSYRAVSVGEVDRIYKNITAEICEDGAAVIEIIPKTDAGFSSLN